MTKNIAGWIGTLIVGSILLLPSGQLHALEGEAAGATFLPRGSDHAAITIIAYVDYLSPVSAKVVKVMDEVMHTYPEDIRIVFKPYPADSSAMMEAKGFGVTSAPTFFINGQKLIGVRSTSDLKQVIDGVLGLRPMQQPAALNPPGPPYQGGREGGIPPLSGGLVTIDTTGAPSKGPADAPVVIVEFSDFQCPFCARAVPTMQDLMKRYPTQVRWVFKHFPLDFHPDAPLAHAASLAAGEQGKFWEMHDRVFLRQGAMKRDDLIAHAKELGLDMERFIKDIDSGKYQGIIDKDIQEGRQLGVNGTPTSFVNGRRLVGAQPIADFVRLIEDPTGQTYRSAPAKDLPPLISSWPMA